MRNISLLFMSLIMGTMMIGVGCGDHQNSRRAQIRRSPKAGATNPVSVAREAMLLQAAGAVSVAISDQDRLERPLSEIQNLNSALENQGQLIPREEIPNGSYNLKSVSFATKVKNGDGMLRQAFDLHIAPGSAPEVVSSQEARTPNLKELDLKDFKTPFDTFNTPVLFEAKDGEVTVNYAMEVRNWFQPMTRDAEKNPDI